MNYYNYTFNIAQEIIDTTDRLTGLQHAKDVEREAYEAQLQQLRTEYKETKEQLISENIVIGEMLIVIILYNYHVINYQDSRAVFLVKISKSLEMIKFINCN